MPGECNAAGFCVFVGRFCVVLLVMCFLCVVMLAMNIAAAARRTIENVRVRSFVVVVCVVLFSRVGRMCVLRYLVVMRVCVSVCSFLLICYRICRVALCRVELSL